MIEYNLTTVTFGNSSAPFLAVITLHQLADYEQENYQLISKIVKRDFYVDDLLTGADKIVEAKHLQCEITRLLSKGGFQLRQWVSNSQERL